MLVAKRGSDCGGLWSVGFLTDEGEEPVAALHMDEPRAERPQAIKLGTDKSYFVNELHSMRVASPRTRAAAVAIDSRVTQPCRTKECP
jgi:hypothetical protein